MQLKKVEQFNNTSWVISGATWFLNFQAAFNSKHFPLIKTIKVKGL